MKGKLVCALALGMVGGAIIVANSKKLRQAIMKGQDKAKEMLKQKKCCLCD